MKSSYSTARDLQSFPQEQHKAVVPSPHVESSARFLVCETGHSGRTQRIKAARKKREPFMSTHTVVHIKNPKGLKSKNRGREEQRKGEQRDLALQGAQAEHRHKVKAQVEPAAHF